MKSVAGREVRGHVTSLRRARTPHHVGAKTVTVYLIKVENMTANEQSLRTRTAVYVSFTTQWKNITIVLCEKSGSYFAQKL